MEHKYNETTATLGGLVDGLIAKINSKDSKLQDWELRYNKTEIEYMKTVRQLMDENIVLRDEFVEANLPCQNVVEVNKTSSAQLKENLPCQNVVEVDKTLSAQVAALRKEFEEKSEALQDLESRYNCLTVKQNLTNQELQDARKESINCFATTRCSMEDFIVLDVHGLEDMLNSRTTLGVKRMGEVDQKAFEFACSLKSPDEDWQEICAKLCLSWEQNVQDPEWHPFKMIFSKGKLQEIVDEDDEKLKELRNKYGEVAFKAVSTALTEMNEYNASGRYAVPEIWNIKEGRRASMKEIIEYIIKQLKAHKRKRKRT
ncbi:hypothetical protein REPUB_Repub13aG0081000 [Reevesia pubescens]